MSKLFEDYLSGGWLKAPDITENGGSGNCIVEIIRTPTVTHSEMRGEDVLETTVKLPNGSEREWTLNRTTAKTLAKAWGTEESAWLNKKVRLSFNRQNVRGEMRDVINGEAAG